MTINEDAIFGDGGCVDEELALACLLTSGHLFLNVLKAPEGGYTTCVYVLANDVFAWGCADAECLSNSDGEEPSEIIDLYRAWKASGHAGVTKWLCKKRNEQPQKPIKERMQKAGTWDDELEDLPVNVYWDRLRKDKEEKQERYRNLPPDQQQAIRQAAAGELTGKIGDHPLFLQGMNEGCGYFLKPENEIEGSYGQKFAKYLIDAP